MTHQPKAMGSRSCRAEEESEGHLAELSQPPPPGWLSPYIPPPHSPSAAPPSLLTPGGALDGCCTLWGASWRGIEPQKQK